MQRHRNDFVALFFGLAFLAAGAGFIVHQTTGRAVDATWIAAVALVSIGCIFLGATLLRGRRPATTTAATTTTATTLPASADEQPADPPEPTSPYAPVDESSTKTT
jgi:hypothetical protein